MYVCVCDACDDKERAETAATEVSAGSVVSAVAVHIYVHVAHNRARRQRQRHMPPLITPDTAHSACVLCVLPGHGCVLPY